MQNKKCDTSIRVFKTMMFLLNNSAGISEIIKYLNNNNDKNILSNETILKYFNTLKAFGINVKKEKDKYQILNLPPYIDMTEKEIKGFKLLEKFSFPESFTETNLNEFICNFNKHLTPELKEILNQTKIEKKVNILYEKNKDLINKLEDFIKNKQLVILETISKEKYEAKPLDIIYNNNKIYFRIYLIHKGQKEDIDITQIKNISNLHSEKEITSKIAIKFRLKGRLAHTYSLKDGEVLNDTFADGSILITNNNEPENTLLMRLLRYDHLCEVISPIETRDKMKKLVNRMLKLYE